MKRFIFVITIFLIILLGGYIYYQVKFKDNSILDSAVDREYTPDPNHQIKQSAWIPYWDYDRGLETLKQNKGDFDTVMPVVYELNEDGSLKMTKGESWKSIQEYANSENIKFMPSIAMFDHELFSKVLKDDENLDRHVSAILSEIENNRLDGIDLDYESTKFEDKDQYQKFIKELTTGIDQLEQDQNREITLSVTVLAKWGENTLYPSLPETREVQDWKFLAEYADQIRIMAYDFTSQYSKNAGPIAPTPWIRLVLNKAVNEIPREKIILGVHTYGYNWTTTVLNTNLGIEGFELNPPTDEIKADAYTYDQIVEIMRKYKGEEKYNPLWNENYYYYERPEGKRTLVFINKKGLKARQDLAKEYGIQGTSYWRLGGDLELDY